MDQRYFSRVGMNLLGGNSSKRDQFMTDNIMALMLNESDSRIDKRKDELTRALINQEKIMKGINQGGDQPYMT